MHQKLGLENSTSTIEVPDELYLIYEGNITTFQCYMDDISLVKDNSSIALYQSIPSFSQRTIFNSSSWRNYTLNVGVGASTSFSDTEVNVVLTGEILKRLMTTDLYAYIEFLSDEINANDWDSIEISLKNHNNNSVPLGYLAVIASVQVCTFPFVIIRARL